MTGQRLSYSVAFPLPHNAAQLLELIPKDVLTLSVSTDALVFNENERGPADPTLAIHLEALNRLDDDEKAPSSTSSNPTSCATKHADSRPHQLKRWCQRFIEGR